MHCVKPSYVSNTQMMSNTTPDPASCNKTKWLAFTHQSESRSFHHLHACVGGSYLIMQILILPEMLIPNTTKGFLLVTLREKLHKGVFVPEPFRVSHTSEMCKRYFEMKTTMSVME